MERERKEGSKEERKNVQEKACERERAISGNREGKREGFDGCVLTDGESPGAYLVFHSQPPVIPEHQGQTTFHISSKQGRGWGAGLGGNSQSTLAFIGKSDGERVKVYIVVSKTLEEFPLVFI